MAKAYNAAEKVAEVATLLDGLDLNKKNKQILVTIVAALSILDNQEDKKKELILPKQANHNFLKAKLKERDIDEAYLARKLQRGVTYVSQRMMGRKPWPMDEAYKIMDMIRAPYDQLPVYFPPKGA